jgi:hypothetical protein
LERGFTSAINPEDFRPCQWVLVVGFNLKFHNEWPDELAKLPETLADAQVARWQSKYGRGPTVQQHLILIVRLRG